MTGDDAGGDRLRRLRQEFEAAAVPAATSLDGRGFTFEAPPSFAAQVGGYLRVDTADGAVLGQVQHHELVRRPGPEVAVGDYRTRLEVAVATGWGEFSAGRSPSTMRRWRRRPSPMSPPPSSGGDRPTPG